MFLQTSELCPISRSPFTAPAPRSSQVPCVTRKSMPLDLLFEEKLWVTVSMTHCFSADWTSAVINICCIFTATKQNVWRLCLCHGQAGMPDYTCKHSWGLDVLPCKSILAPSVRIRILRPKSEKSLLGIFPDVPLMGTLIPYAYTLGISGVKRLQKKPCQYWSVSVFNNIVSNMFSFGIFSVSIDLNVGGILQCWRMIIQGER